MMKSAAFLILLLFFLQLARGMYCSCLASTKWETLLDDDDQKPC